MLRIRLVEMPLPELLLPELFNALFVLFVFGVLMLGNHFVSNDLARLFLPSMLLLHFLVGKKGGSFAKVI